MKRDLLRELRELLQRVTIEGPVEGKGDFEVVRLVSPRSAVSHAQRVRDILDDVIDGGRTGGKESPEND